MSTTKLPSLLVLPTPPKADDEQDFQRYVRQLNKSLDEWYRVNREDTSYAVEGTHGHTNKSILDAITVAFTAVLKTNYDDAYNKRHEHSNKATLDAVTEAFTIELKSAYDALVTDSHSHSNKATLDLIQEAFTTALKNAYDGAVTASHSHSNKATLDLISEAFTTALKNTYDGLVSASHSHSNQAELDKVSDGDHDVVVSGNPHSVNKTDVGLSNVTNDAQVKSADKASQAEAEAGTDDTKWMTPLKTANAIAALAPSSSSPLGSWASKSVNTEYEAEADGFVLFTAEKDNYNAVGYMRGYTDSSSPPTTIRAIHNQASSSGSQFTIMFPVKKGDYWKVTQNNTKSEVVYWIPMGS